MTRDEAVARIQRRLVVRSDQSAAIVTALQDSQEELEGADFLPWFLESEYLTFASTTEGEERVPLPFNFLRESDGDALWYFNSGATDAENVWTELVKDYTEQLRETLPGSGSPKAYDIEANYFRIFPTPDGEYPLRMRAYVKDDTLDTNIENKWLKHAHDLMIGMAGIKVALDLRDQSALQYFSTVEKTARRRLYLFHQAREDANRRPVMGGVN